MYKVIVTVIDVLDPKEMEITSYNIENDEDLSALYKLFKCEHFAGTSSIMEDKECYTQTGFTDDLQIVTISQIKL